MSSTGSGLCDRCAHQRVVRNTRGSVFSMCERSRTDPAYPKYPRIPVLECAGFEVSWPAGSMIGSGMAADRDTDALRAVPLFSALEDKALKHLASMLREEHFGPGQVVATEGSRDGAGVFFIVDSGRAAVTKSGEVVNSLGPGDWFGELALITKGPRTATVTATEELRCRSLASFEFRAFAKEHGDVSWALLEQVVERLHGTERPR